MYWLGNVGLLLMYDRKILNTVYMLQFTGLSSVKTRTPGRLGPWALCYFVTTSVIAVLTGIFVVVLIRPGRTPRVTAAPSSGERKPMPTVDAFLDLFRYPPTKRWLISSQTLVSNWRMLYSSAFVFQEHVSLKYGEGLFWAGKTPEVFFCHLH